MATPTQNILESILSPKIVDDGLGGYLAKTDIVNVDMVQHSTTQCGQVTLSGGTLTIPNPNITATSIILVTPIISVGNNIYNYGVINNIGNGFTIKSSNISDNSNVNYFIANF